MVLNILLLEGSLCVVVFEQYKRHNKISSYRHHRVSYTFQQKIWATFCRLNSCRPNNKIGL